MQRGPLRSAQFAALQQDHLPVQHIDVWVREKVLRRQHIVTMVGELSGGMLRL